MKAHLQITLAITALCLVAACKKNTLEITNLNNNTIMALGHGGMGIYASYPMNSEKSIRKSIELASHGTEIDVQLSQDNVLIAYHDNDLESKTDISGKIRERMSHEITATDYSHFGSVDHRISSLPQLFDAIPDLHRCNLTFDCKLIPGPDDINYERDFIEALSAFFETAQHPAHIALETQSETFLIALKERFPSNAIYYYPSNFDEGLEVADRLNITGISISNNLITQSQVQLAHKKGRKVTLWNVKSNDDNINAISKHPDCIQSDRLSRLVKTLNYK